ncbi:hypothetical protein E2320_006127 [Naja naja]|nr:hypothetical protein E2320_006127 [Naja naja]
MFLSWRHLRGVPPPPFLEGRGVPFGLLHATLPGRRWLLTSFFEGGGEFEVVLCWSTFTGDEFNLEDLQRVSMDWGLPAKLPPTPPPRVSLKSDEHYVDVDGTGLQMVSG